MRKAVQNLFILTGSFLFVFLLLEIAFRVAGYPTYKPQELQAPSKMEPKALFNPDSILGFKLDSGIYKVYYDDGTFWQSTHNRHGYRITSTTDPHNDEINKPVIDIFGCSSTYGVGLADSQTYPFLLRKLHPDYLIRNYALPGYGTANIFVQLTQMVPVDSGAIVIYTYIESHDYKISNDIFKRMYPSREFMKNYCFLHFSDSLNIARTHYNYHPFPFIRHSAFLNFLEDKYITYLDDMEGKHKSSRMAISYLNEFCKKKRAKFIFATLEADEKSRDMISYCRQNNIEYADISLDLGDPKYNLVPENGHPNFEANKVYAQRIHDYLMEKHPVKENLE